MAYHQQLPTLALPRSGLGSKNLFLLSAGTTSPPVQYIHYILNTIIEFNTIQEKMMEASLILFYFALKHDCIKFIFNL